MGEFRLCLPNSKQFSAFTVYVLFAFNNTYPIQKGNIFLCDYKMLDGLVANEVHGRQQYLTAPLVLLYCDSYDMMLPIAIQVNTSLLSKCSSTEQN